MNDYEARLQARRERLDARAAANRKEGERRIHEATREGALPPMGEPIKVGHHSERKHRAAIARSDLNMRKGCEALSKADYYDRAAAAVGSAGISSDDPDALPKLREQVEALERNQALMVAANKIVRKHHATPLVGTAALVKIGFSAEQADKLLKPDVCGGLGFASYLLSNNSANVRRIKQRIAQLERAATRESKETLHNSGVRVLENAEANRIQLFFDGKPADEIRAMLKGHGFRWSPMAGAWQRHLNNAGRYAAQCVLDKMPTPAE